MTKITVSIGLALALALPAGAIAKPNPDNADKRAAKAECKTLRGSTDATREAFRTQFRSFSACVRKTAVEEAQEEQAAHTNAAKECKALGLHGRAFGKCVSEKAKAKEQAADEQDAEEAAEFKNAAKDCDAERTANAGAFAIKYGKNENDRNAFGKCVSSKASEDDTETS
jgi:hypothetical protein